MEDDYSRKMLESRIRKLEALADPGLTAEEKSAISSAEFDIQAKLFRDWADGRFRYENPELQTLHDRMRSLEETVLKKGA